MFVLDSIMGSGGSIIDLDATFFFLVGLFFITLLMLTTLLFNPLFAVLDERRKAVEGASDEARRLRKEAGRKQEQYESRVASVKREAGEERETMRQKSRKAEAEILEKGRSEAQAILEDARSSLQSEIDAARTNLDAEAEKLGSDLADRVLVAIGPGGKQ